MKASLSSASLACSALLLSTIFCFFLSKQGFVSFFALSVLLLRLSQSEVLDEPPLR